MKTSSHGGSLGFNNGHVSFFCFLFLFLVFVVAAVLGLVGTAYFERDRATIAMFYVFDHKRF